MICRALCQVLGEICHDVPGQVLEEIRKTWQNGRKKAYLNPFLGSFCLITSLFESEASNCQFEEHLKQEL